VYVETPHVEDIFYTALHVSGSINIENTSTLEDQGTENTPKPSGT